MDPSNIAAEVLMKSSFLKTSVSIFSVCMFHEETKIRLLIFFIQAKMDQKTITTTLTLLQHSHQHKMYK